MTAATVATFMGPLLAGLALVVAFRLGERLAPGWLVPAHRVLAAPAAAFTALALAVFDLDAVFGVLDPLDKLGHHGLARVGPSGALTLFLLALALFIALYLAARLVFSLTRPRDPDHPPVPRWMGLFGVAPDGSATAAQAPLRLGLWLLAAAMWLGVFALPADAALSSLVLWAAPTMAVTGLLIALNPAPTSEPDTPAALAPSPEDDALGRWLVQAGELTPLPSEPAIPMGPEPETPLQRRVRSHEAQALAISGPIGAGKRTAALLHAVDQYQRTGRRILWLGDTAAPDLRARLDPFPEFSPLADALPLDVHPLAAPEAAIRPNDPPAVIVVELGPAPSGVLLARLRYALHRIGAANFTSTRPSVLVLGPLSPSAIATATRAVAAFEPLVLHAEGPLPTRSIKRLLVKGRLDLGPPPKNGALLALDRPELLPRYPGSDAHDTIHELVSVPGGPRGRRLLEWVSRPRDPRAKLERRLLLSLPGDREVPERRQRLAREALRQSLSEGWQARARLDVVFSRPLVDVELAALGARVDTQITLDGQTWLRAVSLADAPNDDRPLTITEPRSGLSLVVPRESADLVAFEGAILYPRGAGGHEVTLGVDGEPLLVPTTATAATPLRRLRFAPSGARETVTLHRFQGAASLEVRVTRLVLSGTHFGVRRFEGREDRTHTTLFGEAPRLLPPRPVEAVVLHLPDTSEAGLHALRHAIAECLPLVFENAADLGVSYLLEDRVALDEPRSAASRPGIVLWDLHPDGLGAVHDLRAPDLLALLTECRALLTCTCQTHCAACCESLTCTTPDVPLDRHAALAALEPLLVPAALRSTG